ncbi:hypothetical protein KEM52_000716 [Ascosphaera acerosa]|nr:hypothetical protein KEM52_000716 [Ascosphaera acerosa]
MTSMSPPASPASPAPQQLLGTQTPTAAAPAAQPLAHSQPPATHQQAQVVRPKPELDAGGVRSNSMSEQQPVRLQGVSSLLDGEALPIRSRTSSVGGVYSRPASSARVNSIGQRVVGGISTTQPSLSPSGSRRSSTQSPLSTVLPANTSDDVRSLIIRGFSPVVGVFASPEADALSKEKGFRHGFRELLQPFGESIPGKVVIRDSNSQSRTWEDYAVRFVDLPPTTRLRGASLSSSSSAAASPYTPSRVTSPTMSPTGQMQSQQLPPLTQLEQLLYKHVCAETDRQAGTRSAPASESQHAEAMHHRPFPFSSPIYRLFLRRLLAATLPIPHETFSHPVALVLAITTRTPNPLDTIRALYARTTTGDRRPPPWMFPDYLRYYVLIHDEDHDDIAASTAIFDQMKRHFGLHCHLLRLRSMQCVVTDDDSVPIPPAEFMTTAEDLQQFEEQASLIDLGASQQRYLFDSDVTALRAFVRELVAQSVVPHMESRVAIWNDQVASKRRGLSGKFMSISRRWAGLSPSTRSSSFSGGGSGNGNFETRGQYYAFDCAEAQLRKLADYAFMLRDYKLANSTYELIKGDFAHDKAWRYHAGAHEMCAVSALLNPLAAVQKSKLEALDQLLDTASYSYLTRCSDTQNTLRTFLVGVELLKSRGGAAAEAAAKWAVRALDIGLLASIQRVLVFERVGACYASKTPWSSSSRLGTRKRKAGMWLVLAANAWVQQRRPDLAAQCLQEAARVYEDIGIGMDGQAGTAALLPEMQAYIDDLRRKVNGELMGQTVGIGTAASATPESEHLSSPIDQPILSQ